MKPFTLFNTLPKRLTRLWVVVLALFSASVATADPGVDLAGVGTSQVEFGSLAPIVTESGLITWSIDGIGFNTSTGTIPMPIG